MFDYHGIDYSSIVDLDYTMATFENHSMEQSLERYIEMKLIYNLQDLLDTYSEGELNDYIHYNKIV